MNPAETTFYKLSPNYTLSQLSHGVIEKQQLDSGDYIIFEFKNMKQPIPLLLKSYSRSQTTLGVFSDEVDGLKELIMEQKQFFNITFKPMTDQMLFSARKSERLLALTFCELGAQFKTQLEASLGLQTITEFHKLNEISLKARLSDTLVSI